MSEVIGEVINIAAWLIVGSFVCLVVVIIAALFLDLVRK